MQLLSSKDISEHINNIIHNDTQMHARSVDLTVKAIKRPQKAASLDFGGSEFEAAGYETVPSEKRNTEDDYGWWNLQGGMYRLTFNEQLKLSGEQITIISPHEHARKAGLLANTLVIETGESIDMMVQSPPSGCYIKENARLGVAYFFNT